MSNLQFPGEASVDIPNDVSYSDSKIATEDIYIDDSLRNMLYPNEPIYFSQPYTDDRGDFEVSVAGDDLIIFKIIKDLDLNHKETLMSEEDKILEKQKITIVKQY